MLDSQLRVPQINTDYAFTAVNLLCFAECGVDSFKEYQISVKPHTQRSLPDILPLSTVPAGVTCPTTRFGLTDVFA